MQYRQLIAGAVVVVVLAGATLPAQAAILSDVSDGITVNGAAAPLVDPTPLLEPAAAAAAAPALKSAVDVDVDVESVGDKTALLPPKEVPWYRQARIFHLIMLHLAMIIIQQPQTPLLGAKSARQGISARIMGLILAMMPLANAFASLFLPGMLARFGIKPVLVFGAFLMLVSGTAFAALDYLNGPLFVAVGAGLRALCGAGQSLNFGATNTFFNSNFRRDFSMVYSISNASTTLAGMVVPPIGSLISARYGDDMSFLTFGAIAALITAVCSTYIDSDLPGPPAPASDADRPSLRAILRMPRAVAALFVVFCNLAVSGLIGILISYRAASGPGAEFQGSLMYSAAAAFWAIGGLLSGFLLTTRGVPASRLMYQYTMLSVAGLLALVWFRSAFAVGSAIAVLALAASVSQIAASQSLQDEVARYDPALTAISTGLNMAGRFFGEAAGNFGGGYLYSVGSIATTAAVFVTLSVLSLAVYVCSRFCGATGSGPRLLYRESLHQRADDPVAVPADPADGPLS